eukprot:scaffold500_cov178-Alexandrium_tamarense.AAC.2
MAQDMKGANCLLFLASYRGNEILEPYHPLLQLVDRLEGEHITSTKIYIDDKRLLLEAEIYSFEGKVAQANTSHTAAITTSHSSHFIHEEGLCLEMAGLHYNNLHDKKATNWMFRQAKREICFVSLILQYLNAVYPSPLGEESVESTSKEGSN